MEKTKIYLVIRNLVFNFPGENRMESTEEICAYRLTGDVPGKHLLG